MRFLGKDLNFVIFDLSKLDASSAAVLLTDLSKRIGKGDLAKKNRCHWIVALKGLFGVDAYATFSSAWLIGNVVFGVVVLAVGVWVSNRYAGRVANSPSLRWLMDTLAGHNLHTATAALRSLAQFEEATG